MRVRVSASLMGLDDELRKVATPAAFAALVDSWMGMPQFDEVMLQFFADVFQQRSFSYQDMKDYALGFSMYAYITYNEAPKFKVALEEMFARTALGIVHEGRSFTEVATTTRFKLNVPLMATLLFVDTNRRFDDNGYAEQDFWVLTKFPGFRFVSTRNLDMAGVSIPIPFEDIKFEDTLAAAGKTIGAALGITTATLDQEISGGKVVLGALS